MRAEWRIRSRVAALAAAGALAAGGLAACGGGDDDGASTGSDASGTTTTAAGDREQIRATVDRLYDAMEERDAEGVCAELNEAAQEQVAAGGVNPDPDQTCAESFQSFFDEAAAGDGLNLTLQAEILSVKVDGDTAVAKVRFGDRKGSPKGDIPLVKVDGEWKLEAVGGTPSR